MLFTKIYFYKFYIKIFYTVKNIFENKLNREIGEVVMGIFFIIISVIMSN